MLDGYRGADIFKCQNKNVISSISFFTHMVQFIKFIKLLNLTGAHNIQKWLENILFRYLLTSNYVYHDVVVRFKKCVISFPFEIVIMQKKRTKKNSINIYRSLRTQQMSVLVLLCTSYTTCFGPYWWQTSADICCVRRFLYILIDTRATGCITQ
jgi:hypothetical protein